MGILLLIIKHITLILILLVCLSILALVVHKFFVTKVETYEVREEDEKYNGYYDEWLRRFLKPAENLIENSQANSIYVQTAAHY